MREEILVYFALVIKLFKMESVENVLALLSQMQQEMDASI